jgi:hypothetical protein
MGGFVHALSVRTSIPLGPIVFNAQDGLELFNCVPWFIPVLWVVAIFTARGVGRLILRPWRKVKNYGFWLIGLTALLVVAFDFALEPYAWHARHLWLWQPTRLTISWHGASPFCFPGWGLAALFILMFTTPSLIRKQPGSTGGADYHPLCLWVGMLLVFGVGAGSSLLWWSVLADGVIASVTATFAIRGGSW